MNKRGVLVVVSAPSGCGKGTILSEILKDENCYYSVSATTRQPREGEKDGVNYHFITRDEFEKLIADGKMLEYNEYCGNYYGTPATFIEEKLAEGKNVILEIEVNGAMNVRRLRKDAVLVFILPPSVSALRERLVGRGTETAEVIEKRVNEASNEIAKADKYDYLIVNDDLEKAISDFRTILDAVSMRTAENSYLINEVLN